MLQLIQEIQQQIYLIEARSQDPVVHAELAKLYANLSKIGGTQLEPIQLEATHPLHASFMTILKTLQTELSRSVSESAFSNHIAECARPFNELHQKIFQKEEKSKATGKRKAGSALSGTDEAANPPSKRIKTLIPISPPLDKIAIGCSRDIKMAVESSKVDGMIPPAFVLKTHENKTHSTIQDSEVIALRLARLLDLSRTQPRTKHAVSIDDLNKPATASENIPNLTDLSKFSHAHLISRLKTGEWRGFGTITAIALILNNVDFKFNNLGVSNNNIVNFDGDRCLLQHVLASSDVTETEEKAKSHDQKKTLTETSKITNTKNKTVKTVVFDYKKTPADLRSFPYLTNSRVFNWLNQWWNGSEQKIPDAERIPCTDAMRHEANQIFLEFLMLPEEFLRKFVTRYALDTKNIEPILQQLLSNQSDLAAAVAVDESFQRYLISYQCELDKDEYLKSLLDFQKTHVVWRDVSDFQSKLQNKFDELRTAVTDTASMTTSAGAGSGSNSFSFFAMDTTFSDSSSFLQFSPLGNAPKSKTSPTIKTAIPYEESDPGLNVDSLNADSAPDLGIDGLNTNSAPDLGADGLNKNDGLVLNMDDSQNASSHPASFFHSPPSAYSDGAPITPGHARTSPGY